MPDKQCPPVSESDLAEGIRTECVTNREGIKYSDNVCVMIMGFLLTATATLYTFGMGAKEGAYSQRLIAIALVSPIWFIGYLYLAEKRFIILRVAYYLKSKVEPLHPAFCWENWHGSLMKAKKMKVFHRFDPFRLETILAALVIIGNPFLFYYLKKPQKPLDNPILLVLSLIALAFVILAVREWIAYSKCKKLMDAVHPERASDGERRE
jgi:hypothetical protein